MVLVLYQYSRPSGALAEHHSPAAACGDAALPAALDAAVDTAADAAVGAAVDAADAAIDAAAGSVRLGLIQVLFSYSPRALTW